MFFEIIVIFDILQFYKISYFYTVICRYKKSEKMPYFEVYFIMMYQLFTNTNYIISILHNNYHSEKGKTFTLNYFKQ